MSAAPKIVNRVLSGKSRPSPEALLDQEPGTVSIPDWDERMESRSDDHSPLTKPVETSDAPVAPKNRDLTRQWKTKEDDCDRIEDASEEEVQRSIAKQRIRMAGLYTPESKRRDTEGDKTVNIRVSQPASGSSRRDAALDDFSNLPDLL